MATSRKAAAQSAATATYLVVSNLDFNGESFTDGDTVDLTEAEAKPLLGHTVKPQKADPASES